MVEIFHWNHQIVDHTLQAKRLEDYECMYKVKITTQRIGNDTRFLRENSIREKPRGGGGGKFHYNLWYSNYMNSLRGFL